MRIFITGAGGFIGGSVAMQLIKQGHEVSGLVRNKDTAKLLDESGIDPIMGSLDDSELLCKMAQSSDGVINTANADHLGSVNALLAGLGGSGKPFLHTSGSSVVGDDARGDYCSSDVFDEKSILNINPLKQDRHDIDRLVISGAKQGVRSVVICPSLIYGVGHGVNKKSVQIPFLVSNAFDKSMVEIVGKGLNVWSTVHIDDVVSLYCAALEKAPGGAFYFAENGESSYFELAKALSERINLPTINHLDPEKAAEQWGVARAYFSFGSNSRVRAHRAREELNWLPKFSSAINWILNQMVINDK